jgi:hypothetical protein
LRNLTAEQRWVKRNAVVRKHRKCSKLYDCNFGLYHI